MRLRRQRVHIPRAVNPSELPNMDWPLILTGPEIKALARSVAALKVVDDPESVKDNPELGIEAVRALNALGEQARFVCQLMEEGADFYAERYGVAVDRRSSDP